MFLREIFVIMPDIMNGGTSLRSQVHLFILPTEAESSQEGELEAFAIAEGGDELRDFQTDSHARCYDRAAQFGLYCGS
jgi:hypothetical protein